MPKDNKKAYTTVFGGLTGKAEGAMKGRASKIDRAVNKASGSKQKDNGRKRRNSR